MDNLRDVLARPPAEFDRLSDAIRVRLDPQVLQRLDRIVAYAQGKGRREVNRSFLIRDALAMYLDAVEAEFPVDE